MKPTTKKPLDEVLASLENVHGLAWIDQCIVHDYSGIVLNGEGPDIRFNIRASSYDDALALAKATYGDYPMYIDRPESHRPRCPLKRDVPEERLRG